MANLHIHPSLKRFTNNVSDLKLKSETTGSLISEICQEFPKLKSTILDATGQLTPYVNIYINGKSLKDLNKNDVLTTKDKVEVVTALVGG